MTDKEMIDKGLRLLIARWQSMIDAAGPYRPTRCVYVARSSEQVAELQTFVAQAKAILK